MNQTFIHQEKRRTACSSPGESQTPSHASRQDTLINHVVLETSMDTTYVIDNVQQSELLSMLLSSRKFSLNQCVCLPQVAALTLLS